MQAAVNLWPLIGVAVIIVGFVLRAHPVLVVVAAGRAIVTVRRLGGPRRPVPARRTVPAVPLRHPPERHQRAERHRSAQGDDERHHDKG